MSERIAFTALTASDREPIARLLHRALVHWYESRLGQGSRFGDSHEPFTLFPDVYEALDPGECVTARTASGEIVGVCFSHERETHVSIGIVATSPDAGGRGIAKKMMLLVLDKAQRLGKPARLVSSLLNLDSFSLYTRLGFIPGAMFQDLLITVPETGLAATAPAGIESVRDAVLADAPRISDFEHAQQGIRREKDFAFFIRNEVGAWRVLVSEASDGSVNGFLAMRVHRSRRSWLGIAASRAASSSSVHFAAMGRIICVQLGFCTAGRHTSSMYLDQRRNSCRSKGSSGSVTTIAERIGSNRFAGCG